MSRQQAETVLLASMQLTRQLAADGVKAFGVGELGMANTTPAAATISVLTAATLTRWWAVGPICRWRSGAIRWRWCASR